MASENYRWVPDNPPKKGKTTFDGKKLGKYILIGAIALLVGGAAVFLPFPGASDLVKAILFVLGYPLTLGIAALGRAVFLPGEEKIHKSILD